jgi:hypothetical protein
MTTRNIDGGMVLSAVIGRSSNLSRDRGSERRLR